MGYCGPAGLAYTEFMGWDPLSRDLALAWRRREDSRCGGCGVPYEDWYLDDGTPDDTAYTLNAYRCPGCEKHAGHADKGEPGLKWRLVPNWSSRVWRNFGRR